MANMTYTEDQVRALREALTSGVLTVSYDGKSVTYRSVDEIKTALTEIENARAREAGRQVRPDPHRRQQGVLSMGLLSRIMSTWRAPAGARGRGLGKAGTLLAAGQSRGFGDDLRDRPRPPGQVARSGAPQCLGRQCRGCLRHQLHRHRHQAAVDRDGRGIPRGCPCAGGTGARRPTPTVSPISTASRRSPAGPCWRAASVSCGSGYAGPRTGSRCRFRSSSWRPSMCRSPSIPRLRAATWCGAASSSTGWDEGSPTT